MSFLNQNSFLKAFLFFVVLLCILFFFFAILQRNKNSVLEKALKQNQEVIEQKEQEIRVLKQEIEELQKIQMRLEQGIIQVKAKKNESVQRIERLRDNEVCDEFKKLGYNPVCR
ncbi:MAG: hypothetical protein QXT86_08985 [Archaeoglobaceae archaeon]